MQMNEAGSKFHQSLQAPVSFHIQARDSRDKKLAEGGDYVVVRVLPGPSAQAAGAKESEAIVKDNGDGSYTATYSVEARGDYQVSLIHAPFSHLLSRRGTLSCCLWVSSSARICIAIELELTQQVKDYLQICKAMWLAASHNEAANWCKEKGLV